MATLSLIDRIACAAAVLCGRHGDVTRLAQRHGLCRQAVYRHTDAVRDDLDGLRHRQEALRLRQQLDQLDSPTLGVVVNSTEEVESYPYAYGYGEAYTPPEASVRPKNWVRARRSSASKA